MCYKQFIRYGQKWYALCYLSVISIIFNAMFFFYHVALLFDEHLWKIFLFWCILYKNLNNLDCNNNRNFQSFLFKHEIALNRMFLFVRVLNSKKIIKIQQTDVKNISKLLLRDLSSRLFFELQDPQMKRSNLLSRNDSNQVLSSHSSFHIMRMMRWSRKCP